MAGGTPVCGRHVADGVPGAGLMTLVGGPHRAFTAASRLWWRPVERRNCPHLNRLPPWHDEGAEHNPYLQMSVGMM